MTTTATSGLQLRSLVKKDGTLELSLTSIPTPEPNAEEVLVRIDGSPINPSDQGLLFGGADLTTAKASGTAASPVITATLPPAALKAMAARLDQSMAVGNEAAGEVVQAGSSPAAQALLGKTVAIVGGSMYTQYRCVKAKACLVLPPGTTATEGAGWFVNPMTALGMVATMRAEGHKALVHTAAASNLGQMLTKICLKDNVPLVNIVRKAEHVALLKGIGATHVCNSSAPTFMDDLTDALAATGGTIAFDAVGGGKLAGQILTAMEAAINRTAKEYSRYGSTTHKQVYIYGGLDRGPTEYTRTFGAAGGLGGWLLTPFLQKIGFEATQKLRERVAAEIKTTFASTYTKTVSLAEALALAEITVYSKLGTAAKYLIDPNKGQR
ncbi:MAG: zinc-binding dehydrogenase [Vicinamibacteria bacterium]